MTQVFVALFDASNSLKTPSTKLSNKLFPTLLYKPYTCIYVFLQALLKVLND